MIILDLETTGFDNKKDKIIEFAGIKVDSNFNEIERLEFLVNPEIEISKEVLKITGIKLEDLEKADVFEKNLEKAKAFLGNDKIIIGHNIQFDISFLNEVGLILDTKFIDTFELASLFLPGEKSYALEVLSDKYEIEHLYKHRAMGDVLANLDLLKIILQKAKNEINGDFISLIDKFGIDGRNTLFIKKLFNGEIRLENSKNILETNSKNNPKNKEIFELQNNNLNNKNNLLFEFNSIKKLKENIGSFLFSEEKTVVIFDKFLKNNLKNEFGKYSNINFINPISDFTNEEICTNFIKKNGVSEENEGLFLQILFNIFKGKELSVQNINVAYGNYKTWKILIDKDRKIKFLDKNLIDFGTFLERKDDFIGYKKLFIEPNIEGIDGNNFLSFNSLIDRFSSEKIKNDFSKRLFEMREMFLDGKDLGKFGVDFIFNNNFKTQNSYLFGVLNEFLNDLKNEISGKSEFENQLKNINNFLSEDKNFYNFLKITEKHFNLNSQKIDLLDGLRDTFKASSFGFFGGFVNGNSSFLERIFELKYAEKEADVLPSLTIKYPTGASDIGGKHPDFSNFSLNKISEIIAENKDKKIGIFTTSKSSLKDIFGFLLENYPDLNLIGEGFSGGENKTIHKLENSEKGAVFISQKGLFEKIFANTEFKFDILIIAKMPFDPPNGVFKMRQDLLGGTFSNYVMPKSMIKIKQAVLASGAEEIHFLDKRVGNEDWARGFVKVLK